MKKKNTYKIENFKNIFKKIIRNGNNQLKKCQK